jgi:hypothetical protein
VVAIRQGKAVVLEAPTGVEYLNALDSDGELVAILRPKAERWQPDVVLATDSSPKDS